MNLKYFNQVFLVLKHKWYVFLYGLKFGLPVINLILHDIDKFSPKMIYIYYNYFFDENGKHISAKEKEAIYHSSYSNLEFLYALLTHHKKKHHWQYWVLHLDTTTPLVLAMPYIYAKEMVVDWMAAGKTYDGAIDVLKWYDIHKNEMILHSTTQQFIEDFLKEIENEI